ncbi:hypothetical protein ACWDSJ_27955 [Nocardia sp. NPDC003482]
MTTLDPVVSDALDQTPETLVPETGSLRWGALRRRVFAAERTRVLRVVVSPAVATAVLLTASGLAQAAPSEQPGITGPAKPQEQPGVTTAPPAPQRQQPPQVPSQPREQSPLGNAIPSPALPADPNQYRYSTPPADDSGPSTVPQGETSPAQYSEPSTSTPQSDTAPAQDSEPSTTPQAPAQQQPAGPSTTPQRPAPQPRSGPPLVEDLPNLHPPTPVEPPKVIVPAAPDKLGLGELTIARPDWVPADVAWKVNGHIALMQRDTNAALQSIGVNASRADVMSAAMVLGGVSGFGIGAATAGIPLAVVGAVGGGLIGGTIGGIAGAAVGTLLPVPGVGTVTSGVAGTAIGAGVGAAVGAAALGVPAALAGGAAGAAVGALAGGIATAGDGSDYVAPPEDSPVPAPMPTPEIPAPEAPAPSLHDELRAQADAAVGAGEQAVDWVQDQPGGQLALDAAASAGEAAAQAWQAQPVAEQVDATVTQVARDVVTTARTTPQTAAAEAVTTAITEQPAFEPGQFGPLTDAANAALATVQGLVR